MDREKHDRIVRTYWDIRDRAQADPEYARLREEAERLEKQYEAAVRDLPETARETIERYITCRESMNSRMLEFACGVLTLSE